MNFYMSAARVLDHLEKQPGSVKGSLSASGVASSLSGGESKRVLALIIETLKYKPSLQTLLTLVPLSSLEKLTFPNKTPRNGPSSTSLLLVLLHDLLFSSKKRIEASDKWPPKEAVIRHQARLRAELVRLQIRAGKSRVEDLAKRPEGEEGEIDMCRYVRWNPNVDLHRKGDWSLAALHAHLAKKGFRRANEAVYPIPDKTYFEDEHLGEEVIVFAGKTNWWVKDEWYDAGAVILQDKASCMPAKVLMDGWEKGDKGQCIDATAAPGNKTSYLSALAPKGRITAFELDARRYKTLEKMLSKGVCRNVDCIQGDFTQSNPTDTKWKGVTRILLDPSCSGSGIVSRLDYLVENEAAEVEGDEVKSLRLEKLAAFQLQMVLHAFKFTNVTRVVYSTCSIHPEEDERVVQSALKSNLAKERGWILAPRKEVLPRWHRRGRPEEMDGDKDAADSVIRCLPQDRTNGFFVSCFVRGDAAIAVRQSAGTARGKAGKGDKGTEGVQDKTTKEGEAAGAKVNSNGRGKKRALEQVEVGEGVPLTETPLLVSSTAIDEHKARTAAQVERAKRKKLAQKKRKTGGGEVGEVGEVEEAEGKA